MPCATTGTSIRKLVAFSGATCLAVLIAAPGCGTNATPGGDAGLDNGVAGESSANSGRAGDASGADGGSGDSSGGTSGGTSGAGSSVGGALSFKLLSTTERGELVELRTDRAQIVKIGDLSPGAMSLAFAPDGTLFGATSTFVDDSELYHVDPESGATTLVGTIINVDDADDGLGIAEIAFSPDGVLYAVRFGGSLWTVDPVTALATELNADVSFSEITFGPDGDIYGRSENHSLAIVDPATGNVTSTVGSGGELRFGGVLVSYLRTMHYAPDGHIHGLSHQYQGTTKLHCIDPDTVETQVIAVYSDDLVGLVSQSRE